MIASEQANFDAHDWTGQLMLTNEQANFHHGFGRAWRQICQPIHITARKKKTARPHRHCCCQFAKSATSRYWGERKKRHGKCAKRAASPRRHWCSEFEKNTKFASFGESHKMKYTKKKATTTTVPPQGVVTKPWF